MAAGNSHYDDSFNPFAADHDDDLPDFSHSRVVLNNPKETPSNVFDMTEFPIYFDEGLTFRQMMEAQLETAAGEAIPHTRTAERNKQRTRTDSNNSKVLETTPVLSQPRREDVSSRRNIPVYTVGWSSTTEPQMIPASGLDFLTGVQEVLLQQIVTNLNAPNRSAKRYIVKIPNGETLYSGTERSNETDLLCCGSQRAFNMAIMDAAQQEAAFFTRSRGCAFGLLPCLTQVLRVYAPLSMYLGAIHEDPFAKISFTVKNSADEDLYRIFGPDRCAWSIPLDASFAICGGQGGGRLGLINRKWDNNLGDYILRIDFPASGTADDNKMLIIGAAMLIEYMFFEHRQTSMTRIC